MSSTKSNIKVVAWNGALCLIGAVALCLANAFTPPSNAAGAASAPNRAGACCLGQDWCEDGPDYDTEQECFDIGGAGAWFVDGETCAGLPCSACSFAGEGFCKADDPGGAFIIQSNLTNNVRLADDFRPTTDTISQVCWAPAFLGPAGECSDPQDTPPDDWYLSVYEDDGSGLPDDETGVIVDMTPITIVAKVYRGGGSRVWDYTGEITPFTVIPDECYWLEIVGTGNSTCYTYMATGLTTNGHSVYDFANYGDYEPLDERGDDFVFCLDSGISGTIDCGPRYGACCSCPEGCAAPKTRLECDGDGGVFVLGDTCDPNLCPGIPPNNNCVDAELITGVAAAGRGGVTVDFNNVCASDDGPSLGCGGGDLHYDIWYSYTAEATGDLSVTMCNLAYFDTILAFYDGAGGPAAACPVSHLDELNRCGDGNDDCCGDDTCNITAGPSELIMPVNLGDEILIRVGGWSDAAQGVGDARGWGSLNLSFLRPIAPEREYPPWAGYAAVPAPACTAGAKFCHGGPNDGNPCETDVECGTGRGCRDDCWDDWFGAKCVVHNHDTGEARCYIPKNRYLTIDPTVNQAPVAYHVTLHTDGVNDGLDEQYAECGVIEGWLTDPVCLEDDFGTPVDPQPPSSDPCNGDGLFGWVSYLTGDPAIRRVWTEYPLQVGGCEIVPGAVYELRVSPDGNQVLDPPLILMTTDDPLGSSQHFGDIGGGPGTGGLPWMGPEGAAGFSDIQGIIFTFQGSVGPPQVWCDLEINHVVNFADIDFCVRAFSGDTYPALVDISNPSGRPLIGWEPCDCP